MTARINARLDDETASRLERLQEKTGKSASAILKEALRQYLDSVEGPARPYDALLASGFIGSGTGEPNLSTDYKRILTESLARKHGSR